MSPPPALALASTWPSGWEISEELVPESRLHDVTLHLLTLILLHWASKQAQPVEIARNLAVRFDQAHPKVGFDPDISVLSPPPPEGLALESLCLWKPGHHPPRLAIEVVSASNAAKDYTLSPARCERAGINELWVLDPLLVGPAAMGRQRIQVWGRDGQRWQRLYAGSGPYFSPEMQGWLLFTGNPEMARIADDSNALNLWPTQAEAATTALNQERAAKEKERAAKEKERAAKEKERAAKEKERAAKDQERAAKEKLAAHLRSLGIDPDALLRGDDKS